MNYSRKFPHGDGPLSMLIRRRHGLWGPRAGRYARLDRWIRAAGVVVLHVGMVGQLAGFLFVFALGDPIFGDWLLNAGFWVAGWGGAGLVYGMQVDAGGSVPYPGGPWSYTQPERRWPA